MWRYIYVWMRRSQLMEVYISEQNEKGSQANFMFFHFSSFWLKFLPCVYKVVYQLGYKYLDFFISRVSCRYPPAGSPIPSSSWGLKLSFGLKEIQSKEPPSFPMSGRDWDVGAASVTATWHHRDTSRSLPPSVTCPRPCWGDIQPLQVWKWGSPRSQPLYVTLMYFAVVS